jgi:hypothetical protein
MIERFKTAILIMIQLLFLQVICGQIPVNMTDYLSQRFSKYCISVPREEIFIHSDRNEYISGEVLWFNVYLIDRQNLKPSSRSRIVYLELLNAVNRPVVQKRILIDEGYGPGQIVLPDTLSAGSYKIRAYTSWMKNFLPDNCFMKDIKIYNTLSNKAFKGTSNGVNIIGTGGNKSVSKEINKTGIILRVNNSGKDTLEMFVTADNEFRSENNNLFYIFIQTHGNINFVSSEKMTEETTTIKIPKDLLSSGINQITIFNSKGEPSGERYIYTPLKENGLLSLHSADSCKLRDKIGLDIELGHMELSDLKSANLSISVAPATTDVEVTDIDDYLVFGTEYGLAVRNAIKNGKVNVHVPQIMDSMLLNVRSNWIDWPKILSGDLPHFKYQVENEEHHFLGRLLTSDQQPAHSGELLLMCTPGKEAVFQYTTTDSEGNFCFNIHIDEGFKDLILMTDDVSKNQKIMIESSFSDQYPKSEESVDSTIRPIPAYISKLSVNHQVQKIYGISAIGDVLNPIKMPIKPLRFYGKPDIELILANYINLPVMSEIFFELLPGVSMKKRKSTYDVSITYHIGDDLVVISPCLMIDGVIIKDASLIANLDPEIVEKIDVIREKYLVGKYFFPGIVNVITKAADLSNISIPDYMIRQSYRVTEPVRSFISPDYSSADINKNRIPDYRNTLYWNPSVKPGKDGSARVEFWSSDNKSDYIINIQGITSEGEMVSLNKIIKVK